MDLLPAQTRSKLRSSTILTSFPQLVVELVQNSLDASASLIEIGVDVGNWEIWVRDNGVGIARQDIEKLCVGLEERRYATSKAYDPDSLASVSTFGFRGEALASMADLGCLEITSRTASSSESWTIILKGAECLYSGLAVRNINNLHGTVVHVRDAFYSMPVRRLSQPSESRTLDLIRRHVTIAALCRPSVMFTVENTSKVSKPTRIMTVPRTSSILSTFRNLCERALVEHVDELDERHQGVVIQGFISLIGSLSKVHQYLYINNHLIDVCDLHRGIDNEFSKSSFTRQCLNAEAERDVMTTVTNSRLSPRKREKHPVYVLKITVPGKDLDNCFDPAKAIFEVRDRHMLQHILITVVQSFLVRHQFISSTSTGIEQLESPPRKKQRVRQQAARADRYSITSEQKPAIPLDLYARPDIRGSPREVIWTDPNTNRSYAVNMNTGNSYPVNQARSLREYSADDHRIHDVQETKRRIPLSHSSPNLLQQADAPDWIKRALESNEVYASTERPVRTVEDTMPPGTQTMRPSNAKASDCLPEREAAHQFTGETIREARIINQVDTKFIACTFRSASASKGTPRESGNTLVLIDQHAADERIRVEHLLSPPCEAFLVGNAIDQSQVLPEPKLILLTQRERQSLMTSTIREAFARWGLTFVLEADNDSVEANDTTHHQVAVASVPTVIATKLMATNELQDLVKSYIAELEDTGAANALPLPMIGAGTSDCMAWQKALRWCPKAMIHLINSRACRGAIMFNDPLDMTQCSRLVDDLARTHLPFQCAHGRPSIVPISNLSTRPVSRLPASTVDWASFARDQNYEQYNDVLD